jgi:hypothetical protein
LTLWRYRASLLAAKEAEVNPELRIKSTGGQDRIDDPEVFEDLQGARLDAFAARAREGPFRGIDKAERDSSAREIQC